MKNFIFILLFIMMLSCNKKKTVEVDKHNIFNNVNLMEYNGKRVFYLLDKIDRLNYKNVYPIENYKDRRAQIGGFELIYSDSIKVEIIFDSLTFISCISLNEFYAGDSSWTIDNFLKEKIKYVFISGMKNGHEVYFSSFK